MFQEFLDEVTDTSLQPDRNPRYTIRNNNGGIINDDVQIDLKTPVVQNPTPLNRAWISNIQGDLYSQSKYNTVEVRNDGLFLTVPLSSYEEGKILKIKTPDVDPVILEYPTLNVNNLGDRTINAVLSPNETITLMYSNGEWILENGLVSTIEFEDATELVLENLNIKEFGKYRIVLDRVTDSQAVKMTINDFEGENYVSVDEFGINNAGSQTSWVLGQGMAGHTEIDIGIIDGGPVFYGYHMGSSRIFPTFGRTMSCDVISKIKLTFPPNTSLRNATGTLKIYRRY